MQAITCSWQCCRNLKRQTEKENIPIEIMSPSNVELFQKHALRLIYIGENIGLFSLLQWNSTG
jgi:hypothetical protein